MSLLSAILAITWSAIAVAQSTPPHTFNWGWSTHTGNTVNQCESLGLVALPLEGGAVTPPFNFHSYAPNLTAYQTAIGSNPSNLTWTVNFPVGSQLLLTMVDGAGGQAGVPGLYTVAAGSTDSCVPPATTTNFRVAANTTTANTCDPILFTITGGIKPYTLTIVVSNVFESVVTLGPNDNTYTWINRAPPDQQVIVSAKDRPLQLSVSSPLITTTGATSTSCGGRQSTPGISTGGNDTDNYNGNASKSNTPVGAIAGGVAGGILFILACILAFMAYRRRKRNANRPTRADLDSANGLLGQSFNGEYEPFTQMQQRPGLASGQNTPLASQAYFSGAPTPTSATSFLTHQRTPGGSVDSRPTSNYTAGSKTALLYTGSTSRDSAMSAGRSRIDEFGQNDVRLTYIPEGQGQSIDMEPVIRRHADAGPADAPPVVDLPPAYGEQRAAGSSAQAPSASEAARAAAARPEKRR